VRAVPRAGGRGRDERLSPCWRGLGSVLDCLAEVQAAFAVRAPIASLLGASPSRSRCERNRKACAAAAMCAAFAGVECVCVRSRALGTTQMNDLQMIVRAHECVMDGFERFAQGHLITLFSATNYCGTANNAGMAWWWWCVVLGMGGYGVNAEAGGLRCAFRVTPPPQMEAGCWDATTRTS
jgi:hypothetical protein